MRTKALCFTDDLFRRMRQLAEASYPYEGCGVLLGRPTATESGVSQVVEGHNLVTDRRHDRYELDPRDIIQAERSARERGEEVVGFFHTHPDHPARPSQFDTDRAWPGYHYVVIAVHEGRQVAATAWCLEDAGPTSQFLEADLVVLGVAPSGYNPPDLVAEER
ncbi:MAG: M67 family metallopeptidase [Candidatus Dormibacteria bacterium]